LSVGAGRRHPVTIRKASLMADEAGMSNAAPNRSVIL